jgi:hypothetical protein
VAPVSRRYRPPLRRMALDQPGVGASPAPFKSIPLVTHTVKLVTQP